MLEDDAGDIWIATRHGGVCMLDRNRMQFHRSGNLLSGGAELTSFPATSILEDSSRTLWVGSGGSFYRFDLATGNTRHYPLPGRQIDALLEVYPGVLWLGTTSGLYQFEEATEKLARLPPPPRPPHIRIAYDSYTTLAKDRSGLIWMGGGGGNGLLEMVDLSRSLTSGDVKPGDFLGRNLC